MVLVLLCFVSHEPSTVYRLVYSIIGQIDAWMTCCDHYACNIYEVSMSHQR